MDGDGKRFHGIGGRSGWVGGSRNPVSNQKRDTTSIRRVAKGGVAGRMKKLITLDGEVGGRGKKGLVDREYVKFVVGEEMS